jgi:RNA polymerase sigma-70 factor, ECF subfamily
MKKISSVLSLSELKLLSDAKLIALIKRGNRPAFDALVRHYENWIKARLYFLMHNRDDEKEVYQLFLIGLWNLLRRGKYHEKGAFKHWMGTILSNLVKKYHRRKKEFIEYDTAVEEMYKLAAPDKNIQQFEMDLDLASMQYGMREDEILAVNYKIKNDLSDKQIMQLMQKSKGAVASDVHRGRESLKKKLRYYLSPRKKKHKVVKLNAEERKNLSNSSIDEVGLHTWRLHNGKWMML